MAWAVVTDIGVVRSENQDRAKVFRNGEYTFAILCDGMGGHEGGSHASSITIDTFEKRMNKIVKYSNQKEFSAWFSRSIDLAKKNMTKFANSNERLLDMGTTVTAALVHQGYVHIFNIGDSRTYAYNGLLNQITVDHNLRNHYIKKFNYTKEQAATVLGAAALTSALGPKKRAIIEQFVLEITPELELIILTSDGIHDYVSKPNFEQIISANASLEERAHVLIKQAIRGKSADNLTAIILEVNK